VTKERWLITGGAGYIGAHIADEFLSAGKEVVIYDSLCRGLKSRIDYLQEKHDTQIPLVISDIRDLKTLRDTLSQFTFEGVIHSAALKSVSESSLKPMEYRSVNYRGTLGILKLLEKKQINKFIFSSTAAVYGLPKQKKLISEDDLCRPISPYGISKLDAEEAVSKFLSISGNLGTSLRFFNVIGTGAAKLKDNSLDNLLPIAIESIKSEKIFQIFGSDYDTPDGSCLRDYVDVRDVARAHLQVAECTSTLPFALNVGAGKCISVKDILLLVSRLYGQGNMNIKESSRRVGDPDYVCADVSKIMRSLNFETRFSIEESINSVI
jgi:UDP-glucose 4-epimerase